MSYILNRYDIYEECFFRSTLAVFFLFCSTALFAEVVAIDGITYNVVDKAKVATVIAGKEKY